MNPKTTKQLKPKSSPNLSSPSHAHNAGKRAEPPLDWVSTRKDYITRKNLSSFPAQAAPEFSRLKTHGKTTRSHVTGNIHRRHTEPVHHATSHCHGKTSQETEKDANQQNPCNFAPKQGNIKPNTRNVPIAPYPFPPRTWLDIGTLAEANRKESVPPEWVVKAKKKKKEISPPCPPGIIHMPELPNSSISNKSSQTQTNLLIGR